MFESINERKRSVPSATGDMKHRLALLVFSAEDEVLCLLLWVSSGNTTAELVLSSSVSGACSLFVAPAGCGRSPYHS